MKGNSMLKPLYLPTKGRDLGTMTPGVSSIHTGTNINQGLRLTLLILNAFDLLAGIALVVLGVQINHPHHVTMEAHSPPFWWIGILPLTVGLLGLICTGMGRRTWVLVWLVYNIGSTTSGYIYFSLSGCLQPELYGVNMQIYGNCHQKEQHCICSWWESSLLASRGIGTCESIWFSTTVFLSVVCVFTLCLAGNAISAILACVATCCIKYCIHERQDGSESMFSNTMTARNYSTFVTEFVPPNATRSVSFSNHASTSL